jgi:hypothetical protein
MYVILKLYKPEADRNCLLRYVQSLTKLKLKKAENNYI